MTYGAARTAGLAVTSGSTAFWASLVVHFDDVEGYLSELILLEVEFGFRGFSRFEIQILSRGRQGEMRGFMFLR